jgi:hypothetical protein
MKSNTLTSVLRGTAIAGCMLLGLANLASAERSAALSSVGSCPTREALIEVLRRAMPDVAIIADASRSGAARGLGVQSEPSLFSASLGSRSNGGPVALATFLPIRSPPATATRSRPRCRCRSTHLSICNGIKLRLTPAPKARRPEPSTAPTAIDCAHGHRARSRPSTAPTAIDRPNRGHGRPRFSAARPPLLPP